MVRPPRSRLPRASTPSTVVMVHGAIVDPGQGMEMTLLGWRLRRLGYKVIQFRWPSLLSGFDANVRRLEKFIQTVPGETLHLVAHSMGGVITRELFELRPDPRPGRLVAVGSPFLDCWIGRRIRRLPMGRHMIGRTVRDYLDQEARPVWRGQRELGVLAGTFPFGVGRNFPTMPKPNDGVILWEETRLRGMTDHVTFRINHFGLLLAKSSFIQIAEFLAHGKFATHPRQAREPQDEEIMLPPSLP